ncbi:type IV secretory system conjugative DNA transfer family protein [Methylobacterium sp. GC_Met_2]|uniref:type IV secretory system conjugative DNA transfer family protein n=1 Tax=Methylobacterium sp. GC_Met_2 TaxID=2937376 RepID=UPI00226B8911|nr:type IV secretory system conjugative DNA transfer family protein [Methylobacterium sp. GC_Met_2]
MAYQPTTDAGRAIDSARNAMWAFWAYLWAAIQYLWNLTPYDWPIWAKLLIYPIVLTLIRMLVVGWHDIWDGLLGRKGDVFGKAKFANMNDLKRAGMLQPGGRFLGQFKGRNISLHGEGHILTIAAQGGGKTTGLIIPTLLSYTTGTVIVTDPKGAITAQTKAMRETLGPVIVLNPWNEELKSDPSFGLDLGDHGFNPLQLVGPDAQGMDAAAKVTGIILPDKKGGDPYWTREGRALLEWAMLFTAVTQPKGMLNLPNVRAMLMATPDLMKAFKAVYEGNQKGPGWPTLKEGAAKYIGMLGKEAGGQFNGILGAATDALKIYGIERTLANHVAAKGFDLTTLKGDKPITVYVICPPDHLIGDDVAWLNLTLALICQQIGKPGFARETVLLVDEFPALGFLPNLMGSLEQFREAGLRAHLIAQNPGQILSIYQKEGMVRLWGCCDVKQFFRFTDYQHAKDVSDWAGEITTLTTTKNARGEESVSMVGTPLIRPEELVGMKADAQIILRPAMHPIRAKIFPYFKSGKWRDMVQPNPYRRRA